MYKEIQLYDIKNNPKKVNCIISDNASTLLNDLYILNIGNKDTFQFDEDTIYALKRLSKKINEYFT